jgi:hypothetical protein
VLKKAEKIAVTSVVILSTVVLRAGAQAPAYQVVNEGDRVRIEKLDIPPAAAPPQETIEDKVAQAGSISSLRLLFQESYKPEEKVKILEAIAARRARTGADLRALMSLFMTTDRSAQAASETSVRRLEKPQDSAFAPFFLALLEEEDPRLRMFSLIGIDRLRPEEALPVLHTVAKQKFEIPKPSLRTAPRPANEWTFHYEALGLLASWEGEKVLPLLHKRAEEAPTVAELASNYLWAENLPQLLKWSKAKRGDDRLRADAAWGADAPVESLRKTKAELWKTVENRRFDEQIRRHAARKLGFAADDADVDRLLKRRETSSKRERLLWETAIFASRNEKAVPLLRTYALEHENSDSRAAALSQLSGMLSPEEYRKLLIRMAESDPDPANRKRARRTLELSR